MGKSEIARLRQQIEEEYVAAQLGLHGLRYGNARHDFIEARMKRMGAIHQRMHRLVGERAIALVAETIEALPARPSRERILDLLERELMGGAGRRRFACQYQDCLEDL